MIFLATYVLLHTQKGFPWLIFPVAHRPELLEVVFDSLLGVLASESGAGAFFAAALGLDLLVYPQRSASTKHK